MRVGLTGGIASGKTTVANVFAELGVPVIDTDVIARDVVEPGQPALDELVAFFGAAIVDESGRLDRKGLREMVFSDENKRRTLETILHPRIVEKMMAMADQAGGTYKILVIPLLLETGLGDQVDRILVVDCSPQTQLERLISRDHESEAGARRILAAQVDRQQRLEAADDIVINDGDLDQLHARVRQLHSAYCALSG